MDLSSSLPSHYWLLAPRSVPALFDLRALTSGIQMPKEKSFVPKAWDPGKKRPNGAENNGENMENDGKTQAWNIKKDQNWNFKVGLRFLSCFASSDVMGYIVSFGDMLLLADF